MVVMKEYQVVTLVIRNITMSNNNFRFNIYGEGTGAIYKENVIQNETTTPSSSSSTFLNTEVLRNQIESITIEKNNIVPSDAKYSKDISSKQDGSVMLWYTDKDNNSLYEVSIGSENGSLEANTNGSGMFSYLDNVDTLDLTGLDTSNMTSMSRMFYNSKSLKNIDVSSFDTSKVVNMNGMFQYCSSLVDIDLLNFDTSKVTNMSLMFYKCKSLIELDLFNFNTQNVTTMESMFDGCEAISSLNISTFNTSNVSNISFMFCDCKKISSINLLNFDTSKVTTMQSLFKGCFSLITLDLSNFNTEKLTKTGASTNTFDGYSGMFNGCTKLKTIYVSNLWNMSNVKSSYFMFNNCTSLVGTVPFDSSKTDASMANYTNGYLTYKENTN